MAKQTDPGWGRFEEALSKTSPRDLADRLRSEIPGIDAALASNWKQGKARPQFQDFPAISRAIGKRATFLAEALGVVPALDKTASRLVALQTSVWEMEDRLEELDREVSLRRDAAVGSIVANAAKTDRWAVAVCPNLQGPAGFRFHVADRLDFTRVDDGPVAEAALLDEQSLAESLSKAHATRSRGASASPSNRFFPVANDGMDLLTYSVPRLTAMFPPGTKTPLWNQGAVAVTALSEQSGAADTAGFVARILNFGLIRTNALEAEIYEAGPVETQLSELSWRRQHELHNSFLKHPQLRYVWAHHVGLNEDGIAPPPEEIFAAIGDDSKLTCIWLRESDELLEQTMSTDLAAQFLIARDEIDEHLAGRHDKRVIVLDVDFRPGGTEKVDGDMRMEQSLASAAAAVEAMIDRGFVSRAAVESSVQLLTLPERSSIARTLHRWLRHRKLLGAT
jgi:hypothetical protein